MSELTYLNMSVPDVGVILGDYGTKTADYFSFWTVFLFIILLVLLSFTLSLGFKKAVLSSTLMTTVLSILFAAMGVIVWTEALVFGAIFLLALFFCLIT